MRIFIFTLIHAFLFIPGMSNADDSTEALKRDETLLRSSFEAPLRSELLARGFTPRNAAVASEHVLNELVECWKSEENASVNLEEKTVVVRLGGKTIVTHASPCINEFFELVGDLVR